MSLCETCRRAPATVVHEASGALACAPCALVGPELGADLDEISKTVVDALIGDNRNQSIAEARISLHNTLNWNTELRQKDANSDALDMVQYNAFAGTLIDALRGVDCGVRMPLVNLRWSKRVDGPAMWASAIAMAKEHRGAASDAEAKRLVAERAAMLVAALSGACTTYWARAILADVYGVFHRMPETKWLPLAIRDEIGGGASDLAFAAEPEPVGDELIGGRWLPRSKSGQMAAAFAALYALRTDRRATDDALASVLRELNAKYNQKQAAELRDALGDAANQFMSETKVPKNKRDTMTAVQFDRRVARSDVATMLTNAFADVFDIALRTQNFNKLTKRVATAFRKFAEQLSKVSGAGSGVGGPLIAAANLVKYVLATLRDGLGRPGVNRALFSPGGAYPSSPWYSGAAIGAELAAADGDAELEQVGDELIGAFRDTKSGRLAKALSAAVAYGYRMDGMIGKGSPWFEKIVMAAAGRVGTSSGLSRSVGDIAEALWNAKSGFAAAIVPQKRGRVDLKKYAAAGGKYDFQKLVDQLADALNGVLTELVARNDQRGLTAPMSKAYQSLAVELSRYRGVDNPDTRARDAIMYALNALSVAFGVTTGVRAEIGIGAELVADIDADLEDIDVNLWKRAKGALQRRATGVRYKKELLVELLVGLVAKAYAKARAGGKTALVVAKEWTDDVTSTIINRLYAGRIAYEDMNEFFVLLSAFAGAGAPKPPAAAKDARTFTELWQRKYDDNDLANQILAMFDDYSVAQRISTAELVRGDKERAARAARIRVDIQSVYRNVVRQVAVYLGGSAEPLVSGVMQQFVDQLRALTAPSFSQPGSNPAVPPRDD